MTTWSCLRIGVFGEVEPIESDALVEDRRLGGVEVLGLVVANGAAAEPDDPAISVADRKHEPVTEAVVVAAAVPSLKQTGLGRELRIDAAGLKKRRSASHESRAKPSRNRSIISAIETAVVREFAPGLTAGRIGENVGVEGGGEFVEFDESVAVGVDFGGDGRNLRSSTPARRASSVSASRKSTCSTSM